MRLRQGLDPYSARPLDGVGRRILPVETFDLFDAEAPSSRGCRRAEPEQEVEPSEAPSSLPLAPVQRGFQALVDAMHVVGPKPEDA